MAEESKCKWCGRPIKSGEYCLRHKNPEPARDPQEPQKEEVCPTCGGGNDVTGSTLEEIKNWKREPRKDGNQ